MHDTRHPNSATTDPVVRHLASRITTSFFGVTRRSLAITASALALTVAAPALAGDEAEDRGPYYEDDAWYDISEWFDGNDYNPTDEKLGRWDNETYEASQDTGSDYDNDLWFGFDDRYDYDDWFYDYYDDGAQSYLDVNRDGVYDNAYRYFDFDGDGLYDIVVRSADRNRDGSFDSFNTFWLNDGGQGGSAKSATWSSTFLPSTATVSATPANVTGTVTNVKMVSVRDAKHIVVKLKQANGEKCVADLGPVGNLDDFDISHGDRIQVRGPMTTVGNKAVLFAQSLKASGETATIQRTSRTVSGQIASTRQVKMRGTDHLMALIKRPNGKQCLVDLGPATQIDATLKPGATVRLEGTMVNARNQRVFMAHTLHANGEAFPIERHDGATNQRNAAGS